MNFALLFGIFSKLYTLYLTIKETLNPETISALTRLSTHAIMFVELNFYGATGEEKKQKALEIIIDSYDALDGQYKFPDIVDGFVKQTFVPYLVDWIVSIINSLYGNKLKQIKAPIPETDPNFVGPK